METSKELVELVARIAESLVDDSEAVEVSMIEGARTTIIELKVAREDLGKVIGKRGQNALAMRTILSAVSMKLRKRLVLEILDPEF